MSFRLYAQPAPQCYPSSAHIPFPSKLSTKAAKVLSFLLKLRRAQQLFWLSDSHTMLIWAVAVGVAGAFATAVFHEGIKLTQALLGNHSEGLVALTERLPWYMRIVLPAAGGLVAGGYLLIANRRKSKQSSTD